MSEFSERLLIAADRNGGLMKVADLAKIRRSTMSSYSQGHTEPRLSDLLQIAKVCGVSIDWLATGVEHTTELPRVKYTPSKGYESGKPATGPKTPANVDTPALPDEQEANRLIGELFQFLSKLNADELQQALEMLKEFEDK